MTKLAGAAIRVADLDRSRSFYCATLGFAEELYDAAAGVAMVSARLTGQTLLLAGPGAEDLSPWLAPIHDLPQPGKRIYFGGGTPEYRDELRHKGLEVAWTEKEWGAATLVVTDPDGYLPQFGGGRRWTDEEMLDWYDQGVPRLQAALAGLSEADLDLTRAPGKWSIRQLVLHIVDSDCTSLFRAKFGLAEPGRGFNANAYDPDVWAAGLDYAHRPIAAEVLLFQGIRAHMGGLLRHLPGALDRTTTNPDGQAMQVRFTFLALAHHALHHIDQILETRQVHGR